MSGVPARLVERAAEAFPGLQRAGVVDGDVRGAAGRPSSIVAGGVPVGVRRGGDQLRPGRRRAARAGRAGRSPRRSPVVPPRPAVPVVPADRRVVPRAACPPVPAVPPVPGRCRSCRRCRSCPRCRCCRCRRCSCRSGSSRSRRCRTRCRSSSSSCRCCRCRPRFPCRHSCRFRSGSRPTPRRSRCTPSSPDGHVHWLAWQVWPPRQGMPQPPQLFESDAVFRHCVPQAVWPEGQLTRPTRAGRAVAGGAGGAGRGRAGASRKDDKAKAKEGERVLSS